MTNNRSLFCRLDIFLFCFSFFLIFSFFVIFSLNIYSQLVRSFSRHFNDEFESVHTFSESDFISLCNDLLLSTYMGGIIIGLTDES